MNEHKIKEHIMNSLLSKTQDELLENCIIMSKIICEFPKYEKTIFGTLDKLVSYMSYDTKSKSEYINMIITNGIKIMNFITNPTVNTAVLH